MRLIRCILLRYVEKDAYVIMNVFSGDKLLERKTLNLSDTIVRFEYPYQESYGDGVFVNFCMVRDGQVYQEHARLTRRVPDKTLTMKWEVFRDKLRPGQKEEWKLTIKRRKDKPLMRRCWQRCMMLHWIRYGTVSRISKSSIVRLFRNSNWMSGYSGNNSI